MWKWIFGAGHDVYIKSLVEQSAALSRENQALKEKVSGLDALQAKLELCESVNAADRAEQDVFRAELEFNKALAATLQQKVEGLDRTNIILHNERNNKTEQIQVLTNKLTVANIALESSKYTIAKIKDIISGA